MLDKKLAKRVSYSIKDETTYNGEVPPPVKYTKAHEGWKCLLKVHVYFFNDLLLAVDSIFFSLSLLDRSVISWAEICKFLQFPPVFND